MIIYKLLRKNNYVKKFIKICILKFFTAYDQIQIPAVHSWKTKVPESRGYFEVNTFKVNRCEVCLLMEVHKCVDFYFPNITMEKKIFKFKSK